MPWIKVYNRKHTLQHDFFGRFLWFLHNCYYSIKNMIIVSVGSGRADTYFQKSEWDKLMRKLAKEIFQKNFLPKVLKRFEKDRKNFRKVALRLCRPEILVKLSDKELLRRYEELKRAYLQYTYFFWSPWAVNEVVAPWFEKQLKQKFDRKDFEFILESATTPSKHILMEKQKILLLKHKLKGDLKRYLPQHIKNYQWLGVYGLLDGPYTARDFLEQIRGVDSLNYIKEDKKKIKDNKRNFNLVLSRLRGQKKLSAVAKLLHEYAWLRTERVDVWREVLFLTQQFYCELEKRIGLAKGQGSHLTYEEVVNFLKRGVIPDRSRVKSGEMIFLKNGEYKILRNKKLIEVVMKKEIGEENSIAEIVKGTVACGGKSVGKVRVIINPEDCRKMKKGEILVANMTHPDYLFGMQKAGAIVTDEGGISCHAAIISRELGIPCIIGAKIATKVFKDGDLVEVDAEKGVVRKIT